MESKATRSPYDPGVVLVDFDGCLSICSWRETWIPKVDCLTETYEQFEKLLMYDPPNLWLISLINAMYRDGYKIVILTGRMERVRKQSVAWLKLHGVLYHYMKMRANDDLRHSEVYKLEYAAEYYKQEIKMVFDDTDRVIKTFRENYYPTHKVVARV